MKRKNMTRNALVTSIISLLLCVSMLVGTTFAWFTDSVESNLNSIVAGNLDIELEYTKDGKTWTSVQNAESLFSNQLWEPGHTEVVYMRLSNLGSLALKYQLGINVADETPGTNVAGESFNLSDHIYMGVVDNAEPVYVSRDAAIMAAKAGSNGIIGEGYNTTVDLMAAGEAAKYFAVVVYMPESVGNEANAMIGSDTPTIKLGVNLIATQVEAELDSFGNDYDAGLIMPGKNGPTTIAKGTVTVDVPAAAWEEGAEAAQPAISDPVGEYVYPDNATDKLKYRIAFDISLDGIKEDNTEAITVSYKIPSSINEAFVDVEVYHKGIKVENATYDAATRTVTFTTTSFSPFEFVFSTKYTAIPESYSNDEAVQLLTAAKDGAMIDGRGRTIELPDNVANKWSFLIQNGVTFRDMTFKANGDGTTVMIYGQGKTVKMENVTFQNTKYGKKALEISTNGRQSLTFENCTIKGKAYMQGTNVTFNNCSFNTNNNLEYATNYAFKNCTFTASSAFTMNSGLKDILIQNCTFTGAIARLYSGMSQPTNVKLINNTYKSTKYITPDSGVDYEGWKTNGVWIEEGNTKV